MQLKIGRHFAQFARQRLQGFQRQSRVVVFVPLGTLVRCPVGFERRFVIREDRLIGVITTIERVTTSGHGGFSVGLGYHAFTRESVGKHFTWCGMAVDALVHQRLRHHWLVLLVVAETAVAHQIDYRVLVKLHAVIECDLGDKTHGFRVVAVDMENRHLKHFRHIRTIQRRARIAQVGGGEANLIVDDYMHRAAGAVAARLGQIKGFHHHALPRHRGIAVDHHRQHLIAGVILAAVLACAHRTFDHRIDDFQMRRVERQHGVHRPAGRHDVGGLAVVILHVASQHLRILLALERGKQIRRHLAQCVHQHIQAPAVRHADYQLLHAGGAGTLQQIIQQRNQRVAAFQ